MESRVVERTGCDVWAGNLNIVILAVSLSR